MSAASVALACALELAAAHPEAALPCPVCAASVRGSNLAGHVRKVHAGTEPATGAARASVTLRGGDRRIIGLLAIPIVLWVLGVAVLAVTRVTIDDWIAAPFVGSLCVAFALLVPAFFDVYPARLVLDADGVRVRWALGLLERRVRFPLTIEVGGVVERKSSAGMSSYEDDFSVAGDDVKVGTYLRLTGEGGGALTLAVPKGTGLRGHWAPGGWRAGPSRRILDVTLDRASMIAVEYHLASRGLLVPRASTPRGDRADGSARP